MAAQKGPERLQKVLAREGLGSRREIETWIIDGRLSVNGQAAQLGARVLPTDKIALDGKRVRLRLADDARTHLIALNKPEGVVCTRRDPQRRPTVFSLVPKTGKTRWLNVGRLDINTRGLLLFTDNGELVNRLTHPRYKIDREYAVRVFGDMREGALQRLREGVELDGEEFHFDDIVAGEGQGMNRWYYCVTQRGRNRMVRRLWESQGVRVSRLIRVRYGNIVLPRGLRAGDTVDVTDKDLGDLCRLVGMRV